MPRKDMDYSLSLFVPRDRCDACRQTGLRLIRHRDGSKECIPCWTAQRDARRARAAAMRAKLTAWKAARKEVA